MENNQELIKHAAFKSIDGWIFIGKNHSDCFTKAKNINIKMSPNKKHQGFVTNHGRFVDRIEGLDIALKANQISSNPSMLTSEHLWCKMYQAKHNYCEVKGYYLK